MDVSFDSPVSLCLRILPELRATLHGSYRFPACAHKSGQSIVMATPASIVDDAMICCELTEPGLYLGTFHVENYESVNSLDVGTIVQAVLSVVLYVAVLGWACWQIRVLVVDLGANNTTKSAAQTQRRALYLKLVMAGIVLFFALLRTIYFIISVVDGIALGAASIFVFELPTLLFLSMYTSVLYLWMEVIYRLSKMDISKKSGLIFNFYIGLNVLLVVLCAIFFILFYSIPAETPLPCDQSFVDSNVLLPPSPHHHRPLSFFRRLSVRSIKPTWSLWPLFPSSWPLPSSSLVPSCSADQ